MTYFVDVRGSDPLRQGDILTRIEQGAAADSDKSWLVVLTADCDIVHAKFGGAITCVAATSASVYFEEIRAPRLYEQALATATDEFSSCVRKLDAHRDKDIRPLERSAAIRWLTSRGPDGVANDLGVEGSDRDKILQSARLLSELHQEKKSIGDRVLSYWKLRKRSVASVGKEIGEYFVKGLSTDCFFLPVLPKEQEIGFVIHLRRIQSVQMSEIHLAEYDVKKQGDSADGYLRIGRCSDILRFAIAQRAMLVFSRIGLNVSFETDAKEAVAIIVEQFGRRFEELEAG